MGPVSYRDPYLYPTLSLQGKSSSHITTLGHVEHRVQATEDDILMGICGIAFRLQFQFHITQHRMKSRRCGIAGVPELPLTFPTGGASHINKDAH
jgi:hypothetical protein